MEDKKTSKRKSKSIAFQSSSRAQYAYEQAVQIMNQASMKGTQLVKITGNIVTVPEWFPFTPSAN